MHRRIRSGLTEATERTVDAVHTRAAVEAEDGEVETMFEAVWLAVAIRECERRHAELTGSK